MRGEEYVRYAIEGSAGAWGNLLGGLGDDPEELALKGDIERAFAPREEGSLDPVTVGVRGADMARLERLALAGIEVAADMVADRPGWVMPKEAALLYARICTVLACWWEPPTQQG